MQGVDLAGILLVHFVQVLNLGDILPMQEQSSNGGDQSGQPGDDSGDNGCGHNAIYWAVTE